MTALFLEALEALEPHTAEAGLTLHEEEFYSSYMEDGQVRLFPETCRIEVLEDGTLMLVGCGEDQPVATIAEGKAMIAAYRKEVEIPEA